MEDDDDNDYYDNDDEEHDDYNVDSESSKKRIRSKRHVIETSKDYMDMPAKDSKVKKGSMTRMEKVTGKELGAGEKSAANRERMGNEEESLLLGGSRHKIRHLREKVEHLGRQSQLVSAVLAAYCRPERLYLTQFVNCSASEPLARNQQVKDKNESAESLPPAHAARLLGEAAAAAQKSPPGTGLNFRNKISNEFIPSYSLIKKTLAGFVTLKYLNVHYCVS
jgi:hypothetical protein